MKFRIAERKQVGTLYHFTDMQNIDSILKMNSLGDKEWSEVSFTRSKTFSKVKRQDFDSSNYTGILEIDGDKLSDKHKIFPYNYFGVEEPVWQFGHKSPEENEMEERVKGYIPNITKYITKIILNKTAFIKDNGLIEIEKLPRYPLYINQFNKITQELKKYPWIKLEVK